MRGMDRRSGELFSYVDLEKRVRPDHPLRAIRSISDEALEMLSEDFRDLYSGMGRPSVVPEKLLRAMLLQAFHSIRSERQLMERLEFDLLFRWFVGLGIDDAVWDHSTFSKNRDRLLAGEIAAKFLSAVLARPRVKRLLSTDHFSVDGTLVDAWASMKSFKPRDGAPDDDTGRGTGGTGGGGHNAGSDFRGERRSTATHESTTDTDAMLYRKGPGMEARLWDGLQAQDGRPARRRRRSYCSRPVDAHGRLLTTPATTPQTWVSSPSIVAKGRAVSSPSIAAMTMEPVPGVRERSTIRVHKTYEANPFPNPAT